MSSVLLLAVAQWRTPDFRLLSTLGPEGPGRGTSASAAIGTGAYLGVTKATATDRMPGTPAGNLVTGFQVGRFGHTRPIGGAP